MARQYNNSNKGVGTKKAPKKFFTILEKLQEGGSRASEKKFEVFLKESTWLGHKQASTESNWTKKSWKPFYHLNQRHQVKDQNHSSEQYNLLPYFYRNFQKNWLNETTTKEQFGMELDQQRNDDFVEMKKMITYFASDRDTIVTTDVFETGLGRTFWQKLNDNTFRPKAFASRYLKHAQKNYSIGELEFLALVGH